MLLSLKNIHKYFGGECLFENVSLDINEQDRIGLVGVNGCGKSTLLKIILEKELPDKLQETDGVMIKASNLSIGYLAQSAALDSTQQVYHEMEQVFEKTFSVKKEIEALEHKMAEGLNAEIETKYNRLTAQYEAMDGYMVDVKIKTVLNGMGFLADTWDRIIDSFSGGEKTRLALAKLLLEEPNLLILDEPTNHLDFQTIAWLEDYLKDYKGALLIVSHDRYFLNKLCTSVCEIEQNKLTRYKGNYSQFVVLKEESVQRQMKDYEKQQKEIAKLEDYIARNGVRASTAKSAQSRQKALDKIERIDKPVTYHKRAGLSFTYDTEPPFDVLSVEDVDLIVGDEEQAKTLISSVNFEVKRGDKIGIVGTNGIGKSTLLKVLTERLSHTKGEIRWANNVKIGYFEQESESLNPKNTVVEEIHHRWSQMTELEVRNILGQVRLVGEDVFKEVGVLSGGERAKLVFAILMLEHANVLLLDEPTNHLDIYMREVLEEALISYTGTILFVSHDRYLLDKLSDSILELREHQTDFHQYGFDAWQEELKKRNKALIDQIATQKKEKNAEKGQKVYKSKQQRSQEAARKNKIRELEQSIQQLEAECGELETSLMQEDVCSDYQKSQEICEQIAEFKNQIELYFEELILLEEG